MTGALSFANDQQDMGDQQDLLTGLMAQSQGYSVPQLQGAGGGALGGHGTQYGDAQVGSDQEWRDLDLLEQARGFVTAPHTGSITEGLANSISNSANVASERMKANMQMRARLQEIEAQKELQMPLLHEQMESRKDIARIMAGKNAQTPLTPEEVHGMGLAPGTVATKNAFGQVKVVQQPPAAQRVMTGMGADGQPVYADPGAAMTPKMRTDVQEYLRQSGQALPQLKSMIDTLNSDDVPTGGIGMSGYAERMGRATIGQAANAMGYKDVIGPEGAKLRNNMAQLNALLRPTLQADPRSQSAHLKPEEVDDMLPNEDHIGVSLDDARTKYGNLYQHLMDRRNEYQNLLGGQQTLGHPQGNKTSMGEEEPSKYTPTQAEAMEELKRRAAAKAAGGQ